MEQARVRGVHVRLAHAARRYGLDVREASKHPNLVDFINDRKIDVVLDIGANSGQFGKKLRGFGYRGTIISYEPTSSVFKHLEEIAKSDDKWTARNFAIGTELGNSKSISVQIRNSIRRLARRITPKTSIAGSSAIASKAYLCQLSITLRKNARETSSLKSTLKVSSARLLKEAGKQSQGQRASSWNCL